LNGRVVRLVSEPGPSEEVSLPAWIEPISDGAPESCTRPGAWKE
jgi:hypothetical protein